MEKRSVQTKWLIAAATIVIALCLTGWAYLSMYNLPRIKSVHGCACEGVFMEEEVKHSSSIYSGRIERINRQLNGTYRVTIVPERILKGEGITEHEPMEMTVTNRCPYPFQRDHAYMFILSEREASTHLLDQCSTVINEADTEMIEQIYRWLNRVVDHMPDLTDGSSLEEPQQRNRAAMLYESLATQLNSIRVTEEGFKTWMYDDAGSLFFYSPEAMISFFVPVAQPITQDDFDALARGISVHSAAGGRKVAHVLGEVSLEVKEVPIVIKLFDAPQEDIVIRFTSPSGDDQFEVPVRYIEPFDYELASSDDPEFASYMALLHDGYQAVHYAVNGRTHDYAIRFNHTVDRASVYEKLNDHLQHHPTVAWSLQWLTDYEAKLSLTFDNDDIEAVSFTLNGVRTESGYRLVSRETIRIQPSERTAVQAIDLKSNTKETYFTSIVPYSSIDVSPQASYVLTGVEAYNGVHAVYQYAIRDRFGQIVKAFEMDEIHRPAWVDDSRLAYITDHELLLYDVEDDVTTTVWSLTADSSDKDRILSLHVSKHDSRLAVGVGQRTDTGAQVRDLYVLANVQDEQPLKVPNIGAYACMGAMCKHPEITFTTDRSIIYAKREPSDHGDSDAYRYEYYKLQTDDATAERLGPSTELEAQQPVIIPMSDGTLLVIEERQLSPDETAVYPSGAEKWGIYESGHTRMIPILDTRLGLFEDHWLQQIVPIDTKRVLILLYDLGWYMLDIEAQRLYPYQDMSEWVDTIDVELGRIWYVGLA